MLVKIQGIVIDATKITNITETFLKHNGKYFEVEFLSNTNRTFTWYYYGSLYVCRSSNFLSEEDMKTKPEEIRNKLFEIWQAFKPQITVLS